MVRQIRNITERRMKDICHRLVDEYRSTHRIRKAGIESGRHERFDKTDFVFFMTSYSEMVKADTALEIYKRYFSNPGIDKVAVETRKLLNSCYAELEQHIKDARES